MIHYSKTHKNIINYRPTTIWTITSLVDIKIGDVIIYLIVHTRNIKIEVWFADSVLTFNTPLYTEERANYIEFTKTDEVLMKNIFGIIKEELRLKSNKRKGYGSFRDRDLEIRYNKGKFIINHILNNMSTEFNENYDSTNY
jgi:hypothetical protein